MLAGELNHQVQTSDAALHNFSAQKQRRKMRVALALLLTALMLVLLKERQFWFPSLGTGESEEAEPSTSGTAARSRRHAPPTTSRRAKSKQHPETTLPPASDARATASPGIAQPTVSSPPQVEVISGAGQHRKIRTRNGSVDLDLHDKPFAPPAEADPAATPQDQDQDKDKDKR